MSCVSLLRGFACAAVVSNLMLGLVLLTGCGVTYTGGAAAASTGTSGAVGTLSSVVFLGDSLTAGSQNDSLFDTGQAHGYPALLATQADFALVQPLIAAPGIPAEEQLGSSVFPYGITRLPGTSAGRENTTVQATNLAVPGVTAGGLIALSPQASGGNAYVNLVLGYPAGNNNTQLTQAVALKPTTVFLCVGNNDLVIAETAGDPSELTPLATFTSEFAQIMTALKATGAKLVVGNVLDFTLAPILTPAPVLSAEVAGVTGMPTGTIEADLGLGDGDFVTPSGLSAVEGELAAIKGGTAPAALSAGQVLTAAGAATMEQMLESYNQVIAEQVSAAGGTLVDLYSYVNTLKEGLPVNGATLTLGYLGGFFSVDGLHPTNTGYALIANQFIAAMNAGLKLSIATVNVSAIAASDPLFGPNLPAVARSRLRPVGYAVR
jgi:lysophospholipase L1-like esterase